MDTDWLYLAIAEKKLEDCTRPEMKTEWKQMRSEDCSDSFTADAVANFFPRRCCDKHKKHDEREPRLSKQEFRCTETLCLCSKMYCCYDVVSNKLIFSSKRLKKRALEQNGNSPLDKYRRVLDEKVNIRSTNRGFRTNNHTVATYEQLKKGLSQFHPKIIVDSDGFHTQPLKLKKKFNFYVWCSYAILLSNKLFLNSNTISLHSIESQRYPQAS